MKNIQDSNITWQNARKTSDSHTSVVTQIATQYPAAVINMPQNKMRPHIHIHQTTIASLLQNTLCELHTITMVYVSESNFFLNFTRQKCIFQQRVEIMLIKLLFTNTEINQ